MHRQSLHLILIKLWITEQAARLGLSVTSHHIAKVTHLDNAMIHHVTESSLLSGVMIYNHTAERILLDDMMIFVMTSGHYSSVV